MVPKKKKYKNIGKRWKYKAIWIIRKKKYKTTKITYVLLNIYKILINKFKKAGIVGLGSTVGLIVGKWVFRHKYC